jgi:leucyl aminopeptidase
MRSPLPAPSKLKIQQRRGAVRAAMLAELDALILILREADLDAALAELFGTDAAAFSVPDGVRRSFTKDGLTDLQPVGSETPRIILRRADPDASMFSRLEAARSAVNTMRRYRPDRVAVIAHGLDATAAPWLEAAVAAVLAADQPLPSQRRDAEHHRIKRLSIFGQAPKIDISRLAAEAEGAGLTRWLTTLPPNQLTPSSYRALARTLARREGWTCKVLDESALAREGAGAYLAVAQGNPKHDAALVRLTYRNGGDLPTVALVGKGLCFDDGGVNLKPHAGMLTMQGDMQGSAVALGTLLALTRMDAKVNIDCWLALAENCIDGLAYKPHDVVKATDGTTIEVIHTDAEGRMVLADTLALVRRSAPAFIMDFATLTGACVRALTHRYSGVFSNRSHLHEQLVEVGLRCGERVWPFPMDPDFDEGIRSKVADIRQCSTDGSGDHIMAARFLGRFVGDEIPWVHMDLSASESDKGIGHLPGPFTGFGVRYTMALLLDGGFGRRVPKPAVRRS